MCGIIRIIRKKRGFPINIILLGGANLAKYEFGIIDYLIKDKWY